MTEEQGVEFKSLVDALARAGATPDTEDMGKAARLLGKLFDADPDEVAILRLDAKRKNLNFVLPEKLAAVGSIPLTSATALAARTAREKRSEVVNNFSSSRHASVFEGVPLGRRQDELIHKIMSVPIVDGAQVRGVVQISRKGRNPSDAGADFAQRDLRLLTSLAPVIGRFLELCQSK